MNYETAKEMVKDLIQLDDCFFEKIADNDDHLRRVRYNASCVTANITDTGVHFEKVPDLYVIYISRFDMFEQGKTIYHVEPTIQETGGLVDNGLHEIYVNTTVNDGTEIAELMQCFTQKKVTNSKFKNFQKRVNYFKEDKEGVKKMSNVIENYALKKVVDIVDNLVENHNFSVEEACKAGNIIVEEYQEFKEKNSALV